MKHLTLAILAIAAFAVGACAHKDAPATSSYQQSSSSHGYSK
jgi:hypothetical protein